MLLLEKNKKKSSYKKKLTPNAAAFIEKVDGDIDVATLLNNLSFLFDAETLSKIYSNDKEIFSHLLKQKRTRKLIVSLEKELKKTPFNIAIKGNKVVDVNTKKQQVPFVGSKSKTVEKKNQQKTIKEKKQPIIPSSFKKDKKEDIIKTPVSKKTTDDKKVPKVGIVKKEKGDIDEGLFEN